MDAQEILGPMDDAVSNLREYCEGLWEWAFEKFKHGDDTEIAGIRGIVKEFEEIADNLTSQKEGMIRDIDGLNKQLLQNYGLTGLTTKSKRKKKSTSRGEVHLNTKAVKRLDKVLSFGDEDRQTDTIIDLRQDSEAVLEGNFWETKVEFVSLMKSDDRHMYILQQDINMKRTVEARLATQLDDDTIMEIEDECMESIFSDDRFKQDVDSAVVELSCYRYLSRDDIAAIKEIFLSSEELREAISIVEKIARRIVDEQLTND